MKQPKFFSLSPFIFLIHFLHLFLPVEPGQLSLFVSLEQLAGCLVLQFILIIRNFNFFLFDIENLMEALDFLSIAKITNSKDIKVDPFSIFILWILILAPLKFFNHIFQQFNFLMKWMLNHFHFSCRLIFLISLFLIFWFNNIIYFFSFILIKVFLPMSRFDFRIIQFYLMFICSDVKFLLW